MTKNKTKERRRKNAEQQRERRKYRDRNHLCRTCGKPAARSLRTGQLTRSCSEHLAADSARKEIYLLPEQCPDALSRRKFDLVYRLTGALP